MNKLLKTVVISSFLLNSSLSFAMDPNEENQNLSLDQCRKAFFTHLENAFGIRYKNEGKNSRTCPNPGGPEMIDYKLLREETHQAIAEFRDPEYLDYFYSEASLKIKEFLEKKEEDLLTEEDEIRHNLYAFYTIHNFYNVVHHKVNEVTHEVVKKLLGKRAEMESLNISSFNYVKPSKMMIGKLDNTVNPMLLLPEKSMLAAAQNLVVFLRSDITQRVESEARRRYPFNFDTVFMTRVAFRIAERQVLKEFVQNAEEILDVSYESVKNRSEFKDIFNIFEPRFSAYITRKLAEHFNRFDPNIGRYLLSLKALYRD